MATGKPNSPATLTPDQVAALAEEIAALVRCGVPLESGLSQLSADLPNRLGQAAGQMAARLEAGESLVDAWSAETGLPAGLAGVLAAGVRSGQLAVALESIASMTRRLAEFSRQMQRAIFYPAFVVVLAVLGFAWWAGTLAPGAVRELEVLHIAVNREFYRLVAAGQLVSIWLPVALGLLLLACGWWWWASRPVTAFSVRRRWWWRLPGIAPVLRDASRTQFAEIIGHLVQFQVPLPEALRLASRAAGDEQLSAAMDRYLAAIEQGRGHDRALDDLTAFTPLLRWMLCQSGNQQACATAARHAAQVYSWRVSQRCNLLQWVVPVVLTLVFGGGAVLWYATSLFWPWSRMLLEIQ